MASQSETRGPVFAIEEAPPENKPQYANYSVLPWEAANAEARKWSNYLYSVIDEEGPDLLNGSTDEAVFCSGYAKRTRAEKIQFWGHFFTQIAKYESEYDPLMRTIEKGKVDAITGRLLFSEGLLQMSYQDVQMMPRCDFDWTRDKNLSSNDPGKTVLSPYRNLRCGVLMLNQQVHHSGKIVMDSGAYWAVIKGNDRYQKIKEISAYTQALDFCK